ncbi:hypothetical protein BVAD3_25710 [Bacillus velezensis]|nr:hypothetical protein BVAD3_25710 [Bacillus velezensis]
MDQLNIEEQPYVKGVIHTVIYHNDTNLYTVLKVKVAETSEAIEDKVVSVTGYFPLLQEDETYTFYGKTATHPKFGLQFQAEHFKKKFRPQKKGSFTIYQVICLKESEKKRRKKSSKSSETARSIKF